MKYVILFISIGLFIYLFFYYRGYLSKISLFGMLFGLFLWPVLLMFYFTGQPSKAKEYKFDPEAPWVDPSWLNRKVDIEDVDMWLSTSPSDTTKNEWHSLKDSVRENDELWSYSSPAKNWENLGGRAGYAIVRNGRPINGIVTIMN